MGRSTKAKVGGKKRKAKGWKGKRLYREVVIRFPLTRGRSWRSAREKRRLPIEREREKGETKKSENVGGEN